MKAFSVKNFLGCGLLDSKDYFDGELDQESRLNRAVILVLHQVSSAGVSTNNTHPMLRTLSNVTIIFEWPHPMFRKQVFYNHIVPINNEYGN